ncbi:MAG: hypothetical protein UX57_C0024G0015 [Candidatus Uhrbacteria bacterium GW2011_GWE2_46_68]|nr:MAG: hypothetical protein UX57_C0024G0015 [Candidatus Uhrbacteria bacterium GW2011_GWE2_46_68]
MSKISLALFIVSILSCVGSPVSAAGFATLSLSPGQSNVGEGETFQVFIFAQGNQEAIDTARAYISFDPDFLLATDASLTGGAFPRTSPGSGINNTKGEISIGGFTLGDPLDESGTLATLTFTALKTGTTEIALLPNSHMISNGEERIDTSWLNSVEVMIEDAQAVQEGAGTLSITCDSHPDVNVWYTENSVYCTWEVEGGEKAIESYGVSIDQNPDINPTQEVTTATASLEQYDLGDALWYLHVKGFYEDGTETLTAHYPIHIDTIPPNPIFPTVSLEQAIVGEPVELWFGTTDDGSGIAYYEVAINGGIYIPQTSPFVLTDLEEGTYLFQVGAVDYAGNGMYGSVSTRVYPEGTELDRPVGADKEVSIWKSNQWIFVGAGVIVLLLIGGGIFIAARRHKTISQF